MYQTKMGLARPVDIEVDALVQEIEEDARLLNSTMEQAGRRSGNQIDDFSTYVRGGKPVAGAPFAKGTFSRVSKMHFEFRDIEGRLKEIPDDIHIDGSYVQKEMLLGKLVMPLEVKYTEAYAQATPEQQQRMIGQTIEQIMRTKRQVMREFLATYDEKLDDVFLPVVGYLRGEAPLTNDSENEPLHRTLEMSDYLPQVLATIHQDNVYTGKLELTDEDLTALEHRLEALDHMPDTLPSLNLYQQKQDVDLKRFFTQRRKEYEKNSGNPQRVLEQRLLSLNVVNFVAAQTLLRSQAGYLDEDVKPENYLVSIHQTPTGLLTDSRKHDSVSVWLIDAGGFFLKPELVMEISAENLAKVNAVEEKNGQMLHKVEGFLSLPYAPTRRLNAYLRQLNAMNAMQRVAAAKPNARDKAASDKWAHEYGIVWRSVMKDAEVVAKDSSLTVYDDVESLGHVFAATLFNLYDGLKSTDDILARRVEFLGGRQYASGEPGSAWDPALNAYRPIVQRAMSGKAKERHYSLEKFVNDVHAASASILQQMK